MARATRIALDMALVSVRTVQPVVIKIWSVTKNTIASTRAKPIVINPVVRVVENKLDQFSGFVIKKMSSYRDKQYLAEIKYLENEIEKVKKKISKSDFQNPQTTSKALRPAIATTWQYAKTELVPPMTLGLFHGPLGSSLEKSLAAAADGAISGMQKSIEQIDAAEARRIKEQEAALKAAAEKLKAEAKKRAEEKNKLEAEKKAADTKKKAEDAKKAEKVETEKKAEKAQPKNKGEEAKPQKKAEEAKKAGSKAEKKKVSARRQEPKKKRTDEKKGTPPKSKK